MPSASTGEPSQGGRGCSGHSPLPLPQLFSKPGCIWCLWCCAAGCVHVGPCVCVYGRACVYVWLGEHTLPKEKPSMGSGAAKHTQTATGIKGKDCDSDGSPSSITSYSCDLGQIMDVFRSSQFHFLETYTDDTCSPELQYLVMHFMSLAHGQGSQAMHTLLSCILGTFH